MALVGISTVGIEFGYGTGASKPAAFTLLTRINQIGGISLGQETIDASSHEDSNTRYIGGRSDTGGTINITVNLTDATQAEWEALIAAYQALTGDNRMYFEVYSPKLTEAFFFVAQPPALLPMPEKSQNGLMTIEVPLIIEEFLGLDTAVAPGYTGYFYPANSLYPSIRLYPNLAITS